MMEEEMKTDFMVMRCGVFQGRVASDSDSRSEVDAGWYVEYRTSIDAYMTCESTYR